MKHEKTTRMPPRGLGCFSVLLVTMMTASACASGPSTGDARKGSGSKFLNLRYDEDFRYFDEDPEAYESDIRNRMKNIHLGDDWRLDLGGEFRFRMEARSNAFYGVLPRTQNTQQNYRWFLHANLRYGDLFRLFVQGAVTHVEDQDGPFQPTQENHGDLQQLFFDLRFLGPDVSLTLRVGRQELEYGNDRWVGPLEWTSNRRRFDAVKIFYEGETWDIDAFYAKPVSVQRHQHDRYNEQSDFYGLYTTYKGIENHGIDMYFFALDVTQDQINPNGNIGDQDIYTLGARFWGSHGAWDYNTELAGQWGHWASDTVQAWSWNIDLGYTFDHAWRPRLGAGFDMTTGDKDSMDSSVQTINQLFPFNNVCLGYLDLFGRQNMNMAYVSLDAWPVPNKIKTALTYHSFWLNEEEDFLYNAGGAGSLRDPTGESGDHVAQELDVSLEWILSDYASVWLAYAYVFNGEFIHNTVGDDDDPQLFIVQFQYKF